MLFGFPTTALAGFGAAIPAAAFGVAPAGVPFGFGVPFGGFGVPFGGFGVPFGGFGVPFGFPTSGLGFPATVFGGFGGITPAGVVGVTPFGVI